MKSNNKVLLVLILVLLATNLGMLWYFTRESKVETKPVSRTERMGDMMRKELGFNDDQVQQYITLRLRRDSLMQPLPRSGTTPGQNEFSGTAAPAQCTR